MLRRNIKFEGLFFNDSHAFIESPMIKSVREKLLTWLWTGRGGGLILGKNGAGKSGMIKMLLNQLENRMGERIPAFSVVVVDRDRKTIASIFRNLCFNVDLDFNIRAEGDILSNLLFTHLGEAAQCNSTQQAALFVDEMQFLDTKQLHAFAEQYNLLQKKGVNLSVFFVGNSAEARALADKVKDGKHELVRRRFFKEEISFTGITSDLDLLECLKYYDEVPFPGFKMTCTEYFLPDDYKHGWRLADCSESLWQAFKFHQKSQGLGSWSMEDFSITIRILLADLLPKYLERDANSLYSLSRRAIKTAIASAERNENRDSE